MKHPRKYLAGALAAVCLLGCLTACGQGETQQTAGEEESIATGTVVAEQSAAEEVVQPTLIAHAGGAIYGLRYTNTLEALDFSYEYGHRFIELDFDRSSDGEVVMIHDWENMAARMFGEEGQKTKADFLSATTLANLTVLDLDRLKTWMDGHPDAYIITDVKEDNLTTLQEAREVLGEAADRLIPQVYSPEEYTALTQDGWERVIFTVYRTTLSLEEIEEAALTLRPWALTMPVEILDAEMLTRLNEAGICVYTHTVNDLSTFEQWQAVGLHGIYTDYFQPDGFPY
jgi:glycerophosphoryl diester phosphodiesterase